MKRSDTGLNDLEPRESFSRRFVNGVEILEHETVQKIRVSDGRFETSAQRSPKLVIVDAYEATKGLISKARSEISGLEKFLRSAGRVSSAAE